MKKNEIRPVLVRIEESKYRELRHRLIDDGESFSRLVNKLLDEHMAKPEQSKQGLECHQ